MSAAVTQQLRSAKRPEHCDVQRSSCRGTAPVLYSTGAHNCRRIEEYFGATTNISNQLIISDQTESICQDAAAKPGLREHASTRSGTHTRSVLCRYALRDGPGHAVWTFSSGVLETAGGCASACVATACSPEHLHASSRSDSVSLLQPEHRHIRACCPLMCPPRSLHSQPPLYRGCTVATHPSIWQSLQLAVYKHLHSALSAVVSADRRRAHQAGGGTAGNVVLPIQMQREERGGGGSSGPPPLEGFCSGSSNHGRSMI